MLRIALGQAEGIHTETVLARVLEQCATQLGSTRPKAGLLTIAGSFDEPRVLAGIAERYPGVPLIGCTSRGDVSSLAGFSEDSINLLLIASDVLRIAPGLGRSSGRDTRSAVASALAQARAGLGGEPEVLCLALPDTSVGQSTALVEALDQGLVPGCMLFGGGAGIHRESADPTARQFFGRDVVRDALPLLLFAGPLELAYSIENGWSPVGEPQPVTAAAGCVVYRIGERSALDFYRYYLGPEALPAPEFPLAMSIAARNAQAGGDTYMLRVPRGYNPETGAVEYSDPVPEGAIVQITEAVRTQMLARTEESMRRLATALPNAHAGLALMFSCSARRRILGSEVQQEVEAVCTRLPGVPVFGFQARGEIAPSGNSHPRSLVHNSTMVTLVLGVRDEAHAPWKPPAVSPAAGEDPEEPEFLARRLRRSERFRVELEQRHELANALLRTINDEVEERRAQIAKQNEELERLNAALEREKKTSEELLLNILPRDVAEELKRHGQVEPVYYDSVTVLFTDFKGFTRIASTLEPHQVLGELDHYFSAFDAIIERHGLEKLKTIGDAYMCAGGLPIPCEGHAEAVVQAAWEMQAFMARDHAIRKAEGRTTWALRIGINSGPLMAGVIGKKKFAYDIWGDTVNIASRLESGGEADRINLSRATYELVRHRFECEHRGRFPVKNAGEIDMYFVVRPNV